MVPVVPSTGITVLEIKIWRDTIVQYCKNQHQMIRFLLRPKTTFNITKVQLSELNTDTVFGDPIRMGKVWSNKNKLKVSWFKIKRKPLLRREFCLIKFKSLIQFGEMQAVIYDITYKYVWQICTGTYLWQSIAAILDHEPRIKWYNTPYYRAS